MKVIKRVSQNSFMYARDILAMVDWIPPNVTESLVAKSPCVFHGNMCNIICPVDTPIHNNIIRLLSHFDKTVFAGEFPPFIAIPKAPNAFQDHIWSNRG